MENAWHKCCCAKHIIYQKNRSNMPDTRSNRPGIKIHKNSHPRSTKEHVHPQHWIWASLVVHRFSLHQVTYDTHLHMKNWSCIWQSPGSTVQFRCVYWRGVFTWYLHQPTPEPSGHRSKKICLLTWRQIICILHGCIMLHNIYVQWILGHLVVVDLKIGGNMFNMAATQASGRRSPAPCYFKHYLFPKVRISLFLQGQIKPSAGPMFNASLFFSSALPCGLALLESWRFKLAL